MSYMEDAGGLFAYAPAYTSRRKISGPGNAFCWLSFSGEADETGSQPSWRSPSSFTDEARGPTRQKHENSLHWPPCFVPNRADGVLRAELSQQRTESPKQAGGCAGRERRPAHGMSSWTRCLGIPEMDRCSTRQNHVGQDMHEPGCPVPTAL